MCHISPQIGILLLSWLPAGKQWAFSAGISALHFSKRKNLLGQAKKTLGKQLGNGGKGEPPGNKAPECNACYLHPINSFCNKPCQ